ncbi:hypothetical protein KJ953_01735 [Patescibacteria group bacterium]|nr:hypothetical protein [Patescibacteria group bacterium]MBU1256439.1 hypothetical protein [Patescibacteria group bacterium]MBU1457751.1 hypothetical protein [Patescibacteria group bacterium]
MKISDDQISSWTKPWFSNEEERADKTKKIVESAVYNHPILKDLGIRVFSKGSYPNNTNVRKDSDIDIAVELQDLIHVNYCDGVTDESAGLTNYTGISSQDFKYYVGEALEKEFGVIDKSGNKVFRIRGSKKIMDSDVVPCTSYRKYFNWGCRKGIKLILNSPNGKQNVNYPDKQLENGIDKNISTKKRFKNVVRIFKNANNYMAENRNSENYPSFMIECLAYNINNSSYLANDTWREMIINLCTEAWEYFKLDEFKQSNRWLEVNGYKYLFHDDQIWTRSSAKQCIKNIYNLLNN